MSTKTYSKGEVIFRQGDFASEMYDILAGSIGIYTDYEMPSFRTISRIGLSASWRLCGTSAAFCVIVPRTTRLPASFVTTCSALRRKIGTRLFARRFPAFSNCGMTALPKWTAIPLMSAT